MKNRFLSLLAIAAVALSACVPAFAADNTQARPTDDGLKVGEAATNKVGFYGATPVVQPSGSTQAAVTATSTDGTAAAAADLAALKAEAEKIGDDVRALHASLFG